MSRNGDVDEPTNEFPEFPPGPEYARGQASAEPARPWSGAGDASGQPPAQADWVPATGDGGRRRGLLWLAGILALALVAVLGLRATDLWPSWRNPFAEQETDRSQPPLLKSIQDLSRYVAAEGNFQVVIDLQQDRRYVPDFLLNERTLFVGAGTVEAYVDFGQLTEGAVVVSTDGGSVEIKLPAPQLGRTNLDLENSYVFAEERGLLNRLGEVFERDPNRQREVYQKAEERIAAAARDSGLTGRAEENTRKMLEGLLRSLGYQTVTITYAQP